jgi:hypothetical protein
MAACMPVGVPFCAVLARLSPRRSRALSPARQRLREVPLDGRGEQSLGLLHRQGREGLEADDIAREQESDHLGGHHGSPEFSFRKITG